MDDAWTRARSLVAGAHRVVALTGAGISTASGIPDFRGPEGVWTKDPHAEMLSNFATWTSSPEIRRAAWRSRAERRDDHAEPNDGHRAFVSLAQRGVLDLLVTQNIDGLHQRAGLPDDLVVEIHGAARDAVCLRCGHRQPIDQLYPRIVAGDDDPTCQEMVDGARCAGMMKSATISFGQSLVASDLHRSEQAAAHCDLLLAVGSTLSVYPVAGLVPLAKHNGASVIIVNGEATALDAWADVQIVGDITTQLPALLAD